MSVDPWSFQRWAFRTRTGSAPAKAVLMALAVMADLNTGRCEAKVERLCEWTELSERAVRTHLKGLAEAGVIARRPQYRKDHRRRGDEFLLLAPGVTEWPDSEPVKCPAPDAPHNDSVVQEMPGMGAGGAAQEQPPHGTTAFVVVGRPHSDVVGALIHGGFDKGTIEQYNGAIVGALHDLSPAEDTDWFRVGVLIDEAMRPGSPMRRSTPSAALKFVALGAGLPRVGEITRPKRTNRAEQNEAEGDAMFEAMVNSMTQGSQAA